MAIDLDLKILCRVDRKAVSVTLWDNTVIGPTNTYGWQPEGGGSNTNNPKKSEVTAIKLTLTDSDGNAYIYDLDAGERTAYLDNTQGATIEAADIFGASVDNIPDDIVQIQMLCSGATIGGAPSAWSAYANTYQAFTTFLENSIRGWVTAIPVPVRNLSEVFDTAMANIMLDALHYNVAFGQIEQAQTIMDFLTELIASGQMMTEYVQEHNT